jgi:hypothetical protein
MDVMGIISQRKTIKSLEFRPDLDIYRYTLSRATQIGDGLDTLGYFDL